MRAVTGFDGRTGLGRSPARVMVVMALGIAMVLLGVVPEASAATKPGVTVSTASLLRNGRPFYLKAFNSIAVVQPENCPRKDPKPTAAAQNFGPAMLQAMVSGWSANTIRFQVSQKALDPLDPELAGGQAAYLAKVQTAVAQARTAGLVVILSMQDQAYSCGYAHPLPSSQTIRAWSALVPLYGKDRNVLFELFNEPVSPESREGWAQWRNGGTTPLTNTGTDGSVHDVVGHQQLLNSVRSRGSVNVVIADGANKGGRLQNLWTSSTDNYLLRDTQRPAQIAYGIHPYFFHTGDDKTLASDQANWYLRFGYLRDPAKISATSQFPIVATEWNATASCFVGQAARTPEFLTYLAERGIGVTGHAIDVAGLLVTAVPGWQPNDFSTGGGECSPGSGGGAALDAFFAAR